MRLFRALTASLSLVSSAACGGGDLVLPEDQSPADMVLVDGDGQAGSVGAELPDPLVVQVVDAENRPIAGVRVAFALGARADGGDTSPDTALTNAEGLASTRWILGGSSGRQEVKAEIVGAGLEVGFFAEAERTSTLRLERVSGDEQRGSRSPGWWGSARAPPTRTRARPTRAAWPPPTGRWARGRDRTPSTL